MALVVKHVKALPSGRAEYRRAFPVSLLPFIPGKEGQQWAEFKRSLGPQDGPEFTALRLAAVSDFEAIVSAARKRKDGVFDQLDTPTIVFLAETYRAQRGKKDEDFRWNPQRWGGKSGDPTWSHLHRGALLASRRTYTDLRARADADAILETWQSLGIELAAAHGVVVSPADRNGLVALSRALNDAAIQAIDDNLARYGGRHVPLPSAPEPPQTKMEPKALPPSVPLMATYEAYAAEQGISPNVRTEWRAHLSKLVLFVGHDDAALLTADDIVRWKDHLLSEPTRAGGKRSPVTVNDKYLTSLKATLTWAVDQRRLSENVAHRIRARVPKRVKLRERSFTSEEVSRILKAALVPASDRTGAGLRRARRWVPWLCAYTGARVGELAQLRVEDVRQVDGIWTIRITPEAGTVKGREFREVPIHEHLLDQGFLQAVQEVGTGPIFYDPQQRRSDGEANRHIKKVGERLAEWVRNDVGITDAGIMPNHAWRHTFKSVAVGVGILERLSDAITGHKPDSVARRYEAPTVTMKANAIREFPRYGVNAPGGFNPDLAHLVPVAVTGAAIMR